MTFNLQNQPPHSAAHVIKLEKKGINSYAKYSHKCFQQATTRKPKKNPSEVEANDDGEGSPKLTNMALIISRNLVEECTINKTEPSIWQGIVITSTSSSETITERTASVLNK